MTTREKLFLIDNKEEACESRKERTSNLEIKWLIVERKSLLFFKVED